MGLKGVANLDQPREKALLYGIDTLTNPELLAILLRCGNKQESALALGNRILNSINGIHNLMNITLLDLTNIQGIKNAKALTILAALELNKRIRQEDIPPKVALSNAKSAYEYVRGMLEYETQEKVLVLYVNAKCEVIKEKVLFTGTTTMSIISPKDIFREALICNGVGIFLFHNHPSGSSEPSGDDLQMTKKVILAGQCFDIKVIDHIIVGKNEYYSMKEHQLF